MTDTQITELFYIQLDALVGDNVEGDVTAASARAASMKKQISVWTLSDGISGMSLTEQQKQQQNDDEFVDDILIPLLLQYVDALIATEDSNNEMSERAMDLLSALAVAYGESASEAVADKAMEYSSVLLERVRCQACKLMGYLASHLLSHQQQDSSSSWAEEWFDAIKEAMIPRMSDKIQSVRHSAIRACAYFFIVDSTEGVEAINNKNADDLLESMLWSMWHDPSAAIRAAAIDSVPVTNDTVAHIITRIRDEKEKVRLQAIDVLKAKVDPTSGILGAEHFAEIIKSGLLASRCDATKHETKKLICTKWMKSSKFNPVQMIRDMGASLYEDECEKVIEVVLKAIRSGDTDILAGLSNPEIRAFQESGDEYIIELADASMEFDLEDIFFARIACCSAEASEDLSPIQKESIINRIAPDIQVICQLLARRIGILVEATEDEDTATEDTHSFVCLQLLRLAQVAGLREEGSRRLFLSAIQEVLSSPETPDDLVEECVRSLKSAHETEYDFFATISITVSEISALETNDVSSKMHLTLRNLIILTIVLENASVKMSNHHTLDDFSEFIMGAVRDESASDLVREAAVSALGRLGLLMTETTVVDVFKPTLLSIASNRDEKLEIRSQGLMALSDWSLLFPQLLEPWQFEDGTTVSVVDVISEMMLHNNPTMVAFSTEVAAKLLLAGRICESNLIAHLLVIFFDPNLLPTEANEDGDEKDIGSPIRLQQVLSLFFPAYCIKSETGRDAMLDAIESTLQMANSDQFSSKKSKKKKRSPFPHVKMVEFVCSVVDSGKQVAAAEESESDHPPSTPKGGGKGGGESPIDTATSILASIQVAKFLSNDDNSLNLTETRALCKFLGSQDIDVSVENSYHLHALKVKIEELGMVVTDSTSSRAIKAVSELLVDIPENNILEEDDIGPGPGDHDDDDDRSSQGTITEDEAETLNDNDVSTGDTTIEEDSALMESMHRLSVSKENVSRSSTNESSLSKASGSTSNRVALSSHSTNQFVE